jgi:hypothetical protein
LAHSITTPDKSNINSRTRIIKEDGEAITTITATSTTTTITSTATKAIRVIIKAVAAITRTTTEAATKVTKAVEASMIDEVVVDNVAEVSPVEEDLAVTTEVIVVATIDQ